MKRLFPAQDVKAKPWNAVDVSKAKDVKKSPLRLQGRGGLAVGRKNVAPR